jgi:hypothetical protein
MTKTAADASAVSRKEGSVGELTVHQYLSIGLDDVRHRG